MAFINSCFLHRTFFLSSLSIACLFTACKEQPAPGNGITTVAVPAENHSPSPGTDTTEVTAAGVPAPDEPEARIEETGWRLMDTETFGELHLGMAGEEVLRLLGPPDQQDEEVYLGYDGGYHSSWDYRSKGLLLDMNRVEDHPDEAMQQTHIDRITLLPPSGLLTSRGIGIGSSREQVVDSYGDVLNTPVEKEGSLEAGTVYGGLFFMFREDRVVEIFLGHMAE